MKYPKSQRVFCPKCNKHTEHTVKEVKGKGRAKSHPNSRANLSKLRHDRGFGGHGKYSKPPVKKKPTQKKDLRFKCKECGKSFSRGQGFRVKKFEMV